MRRIIMGLLVLSSVACDVEVGPEGEPLEFDDDAIVDELTDETRSVASAGATVSIVSWVHNGTTLRHKANCEDFQSDSSLPGNDDCYCTGDSALTGQINGNNGGDKCVVCRWWQWESGDCELDTDQDVDLVFKTNGTSQYSYVDDGQVANLTPNSPWTLGCQSGSCPCSGADCSCTESSMDFAVSRANAGGIVSDPSSIIELVGCP